MWYRWLSMLAWNSIAKNSISSCLLIWSSITHKILPWWTYSLAKPWISHWTKNWWCVWVCSAQSAKRKRRKPTNLGFMESIHFRFTYHKYYFVLLFRLRVTCNLCTKVVKLIFWHFCCCKINSKYWSSNVVNENTHIAYLLLWNICDTR